MYLRKNPRKDGRVHLSIVRGYRDKQGKPKAKTIKTLGYLDELEKEFSDPIAHFSAVVDDMNEEEKDFSITLAYGAKIEEGTANRKNFGYAVFSKIYHELEIDYFLTNKFKHSKINESNINNIMKLLVFSRLLYPSSKKSAYENRDIFFENTNYSLKEVYNALTYLAPIKEKLQRSIYEHIKEQYNPNTDCVYYDVTNYYFEIDEPDELRKKGVSKEHRPNPIVQMGLLMDSAGFPIAYKLFSGNTNDCKTLLPILSEVKKNYDLGKVIVVADKGLNTSDNIAYNILKRNGYVYSQTVRGANAELKAFVLEQKGYTSIGEEYRCKSRLYPKEITVEDVNGKKKVVRIDEKQVIFYSEKYARRAKAERQPAIDKALLLIKTPQKFNKTNSYGAAKYVKHLVFDKKTGEIIKAQSMLSLNEEKLRQEELFDGYYAIVTSEYKKTDEEIIDIYRGLWKIEESFKITKSTLNARPVFLTREERIESHFLTCYIALVIARVLQHKTEHRFSIEQMITAIEKISCSHIAENYYLFDYQNELTKVLGETFDIDFSQKILPLKTIKNILAKTKKVK